MLSLIELPQLNTIFSRILAYSQDFIILDKGITIKWNEVRSLRLREGIVK
jgi:hypothetical protein